MFGTMISNLMIKPGKSPIFNSPKDFDLDFEDVAFQASDGVTLRGWLIKGGTDKVIIQSHFGVQCSRAGYTPKGKGLIKMWKEDISFLRHAEYLSEQGYTVLMYDMRNHGESGLGTIPWISWGPEEAKDVIAAAGFITRHPRYKGADIGLLSICMGAVASTYAYGMGDQGLRRYANIKAMIAVQPLHYKEFTKALGMPGFLRRAASSKSQKRLGFDLNTRTFMTDVKHITVPTLVMQNKNDPMTDLDFVQQYYDELQVEKELLWLDLAKSRAAAYDYLPRNPGTISRFLDKYMR
jgi:pimeloyl-ACP methyl ester carboxylesterase